MRRAIYAVAAMAACLVWAAPAAAARATKSHERWGHGAHPVRVAAVQPTSADLLQDMLFAADEWWARQGSPPPCALAADVQWGTSGQFSAHATVGGCEIVLSPNWWATQYRYLTGHRGRRGRVKAAAEDLALLIHERGHNIGYSHIPGTVMQEGSPVVPGWAFEWAAREVG